MGAADFLGNFGRGEVVVDDEADGLALDVLGVTNTVHGDDRRERGKRVRLPLNR